MPANNTPADEYVPTLLQYAEVIAWLDDERRLAGHTSAVGTAVVPTHLKRVYDDAIRRESLGRLAKAMQAAEDEAADLSEVEFDPDGMDWL